MERINNHETERPSPEEQNRQRGNKAEAIVISRTKAKKALYNLVAGALATGFVAGFIVGGAANEAKHNKTPLSEEEYREELSFFLDHQDKANIIFNEDGSATVSYEQTPFGRAREYTLEDYDRDTQFEHGLVVEERGGEVASFDSEDGLDINSAQNELDIKVNQAKFSNLDSN